MCARIVWSECRAYAYAANLEQGFRQPPDELEFVEIGLQCQNVKGFGTHKASLLMFWPTIQNSKRAMHLNAVFD